jgi:hypothetical protein
MQWIEFLMTRKVAIVIRTHIVDKFLIGFAQAISSSMRYDVIFAIDQSGDPINVTGFDKIGLNREEFARLGLFTQIDDVLWRCGDYVLYLVRQQRPQYELFWMIEYDVAIDRADPISFFEEVDMFPEYQLLSTHFRQADRDWPWRATMEGAYSNIFRCFFPLLRIHASAIDFLFEARRDESSKAARTIEQKGWPNDEVFCATVLANNGFRCCDLNEIGRYYTPESFNWSAVIHPCQIAGGTATLYHSVRRGLDFIKSASRSGKSIDIELVLSKLGIEWIVHEDGIEEPLKAFFVSKIRHCCDDPHKAFGKNSIFHPFMQEKLNEGVVRSILRALAEARMVFCLEFIREHYRAWCWPEVGLIHNVALGRPAWQSSVCEWSNVDDLRRDAEGANDGSLEIDYGFHTDREEKPWWVVDLQRFYNLSEIRLFNRRKHYERLNAFTVFSSMDYKEWYATYEFNSESIPTCEDPIIMKIECGRPAKYIKIQHQRTECLHFRECEVYGSPIMPHVSVRQ